VTDGLGRDEHPLVVCHAVGCVSTALTLHAAYHFDEVLHDFFDEVEVVELRQGLRVVLLGSLLQLGVDPSL
jgi:hypothetical protein